MSCDVLVIGSGPNGLAAAVTAARAGLSVTVLEAEAGIGGGARTADLGLAAGIEHDICSAVHPMALASPFFSAFDLPARGVELLVPEVSYAQPLEAEPAAIAWHDLERTAAGLGADASRWRALFAPLVAAPEAVVALALGDKRSVPGEILSASGLRAALTFACGLAGQGSPLISQLFRTPAASALLSGVAAHAIGPLPSPATAGSALLLAALGHAQGWPIPRGGSQAIIEALAADLRAHGGQIITGHPVSTWTQLPPARAYLLDTTAEAAAAIFADRLPRRTVRGLRRFGHGNAAAKVDFVLSGPVPWRDPDVGRAGTVHVGGTRMEMAAAERAVACGVLPPAPMVLASDPAVLDAGREVSGLRPLWTYAHVPFGCEADVTEHITRQIERFAPGFRDVVVASRCVPASRMAEHNANWVGGDIATGTVTLARMLARPRATWDPYRIGDIRLGRGEQARVAICSAATVPGPGVHGLCGHGAMTRVLADVFGLRTPVDLSPRAVS